MHDRPIEACIYINFSIHLDKPSYKEDGSQKITVSEIHRKDNADVAILKLTTPAVLNDKVGLVEPKCDAVMAKGDNCTALGWGYIQVGMLL